MFCPTLAQDIMLERACACLHVVRNLTVNEQNAAAFSKVHVFRCVCLLHLFFDLHVRNLTDNEQNAPAF